MRYPFLEGIKLYIDSENAEHQCRALSNSNQSNYITQLFLSLQDYYQDDDDEDEYTYLEDLNDVQMMQALASLDVKNLIDLTIKANRFNQICLSELNGFLDTMPQLSRITVHDIRIMPNRSIINISTKLLSIKSIQIHNLKLRSLEEHLVVSMIMRNLLPQCPDLDMSFKDISREDLASITLDFRKSINLIQLLLMQETIETNSTLCKIFQLQTNTYYLYDHNKNTMVEKDSLTSGNYYTTILLSQPVLLNSRKI